MKLRLLVLLAVIGAALLGCTRDDQSVQAGPGGSASPSPKCDVESSGQALELVAPGMAYVQIGEVGVPGAPGHGGSYFTGDAADPAVVVEANITEVVRQGSGPPVAAGKTKLVTSQSFSKLYLDAITQGAGLLVALHPAAEDGRFISSGEIRLNKDGTAAFLNPCFVGGPALVDALTNDPASNPRHQSSADVVRAIASDPVFAQAAIEGAARKVPSPSTTSLSLPPGHDPTVQPGVSVPAVGADGKAQTQTGESQVPSNVPHSDNVPPSAVPVPDHASTPPR